MGRLAQPEQRGEQGVSVTKKTAKPRKKTGQDAVGEQ